MVDEGSRDPCDGREVNDHQGELRRSEVPFY
jgi:hypothetical protein